MLILSFLRYSFSLKPNPFQKNNIKIPPIYSFKNENYSFTVDSILDQKNYVILKSSITNLGSDTHFGPFFNKPKNNEQPRELIYPPVVQLESKNIKEILNSEQIIIGNNIKFLNKSYFDNDNTPSNIAKFMLVKGLKTPINIIFDSKSFNIKLLDSCQFTFLGENFKEEFKNWEYKKKENTPIKFLNTIENPNFESKNIKFEFNQVIDLDTLIQVSFFATNKGELDMFDFNSHGIYTFFDSIKRNSMTTEMYDESGNRFYPKFVQVANLSKVGDSKFERVQLIPNVRTKISYYFQLSKIPSKISLFKISFSKSPSYSNDEELAFFQNINLTQKTAPIKKTISDATNNTELFMKLYNYFIEKDTLNITIGVLNTKKEKNFKVYNSGGYGGIRFDDDSLGFKEIPYFAKMKIGNQDWNDECYNGYYLVKDVPIELKIKIAFKEKEYLKNDRINITLKPAIDKKQQKFNFELKLR